MTRAQLEHLIRAASQIVDEQELIVLGSQAVLGSWPDAPAPMRVSMEADMYPRHRPELADLIDGTIGELSPFHQTFGYYAHGVGPKLARLPSGWQGRLVPVRNENTLGATGWCLELHDLLVSKLVAGREKDLAFVQTAVEHGRVDLSLLEERLAATELDGAVRELVAVRINRLAIP